MGEAKGGRDLSYFLLLFLSHLLLLLLLLLDAIVVLIPGIMHILLSHCPWCGRHSTQMIVFDYLRGQI
jgi:hypothetical protein